MSDETSEGRSLLDILLSRRSKIEAVLPHNIDPDRFLEVLLRAVQTTPDLSDCTVSSIVLGCQRAAECGLEVNTTRQHGFLSARNGKAVFQPGVHGRKWLAELNERVSYIQATLVRQNDHFLISYGLSPGLAHNPPSDGDRGEVVGCYAIVRLENGQAIFEYMEKSEIEKTRKDYSPPNSSSWRKSWGEMAKKTVISRVLKVVPASRDDRLAACTSAAAGPSDDSVTLDIEPSESQEQDKPKSTLVQRMQRNMPSDAAESVPSGCDAPPEPNPEEPNPEEPVPEEPVPKQQEFEAPQELENAKEYDGLQQLRMAIAYEISQHVVDPDSYDDLVAEVAKPATDLQDITNHKALDHILAGIVAMPER